MKRTKCSKSGGKSKTKGFTMDKAIVTRRESKEKGVKTRAPGPVDDVDLADEVQKRKESQRNIRGQSQQIRYRRLGMCLRALSETLRGFLEFRCDIFKHIFMSQV